MHPRPAVSDFSSLAIPGGGMLARVDSLDIDAVLPLIRLALAEDVGTGDVTSLSVLPPGASASARLVAREGLVACGLEVAKRVFEERSEQSSCRRLVEDGQAVEAGRVLMEVIGPAQAVLEAERVALNFVQRLAGIATQTARYVEAVRGTGAQILDTRKTTPGWRVLEKYAVRCGGGMNHRMGLHDQILIKDNHLAVLARTEPNPVAAAVARARAAHPGLRVEVEADTIEQAQLAAEAGADMVLMDNMAPEALRAAVARVAGRCRTEASGGVTLDTVRRYAETGVDYISVGALTHTVRSMDIAMDIETRPRGETG